MTVRAYIAVEGPHDAELIAKLLRLRGFNRVKKMSDLDPYWDKLVPRTFPHNNDLLMRVPVPLFLQGNAGSVALHAAIGIDSLVKRTEESIAQLDELPAIAVILDADSEQAVNDRFAVLAVGLRKLGLAVPDQPGAVSQQTLRCGVFVLPDNAAFGTLETLLVECAHESYPQLLSSATAYVDSVDRTRLTSEDTRDLRKPAGRTKAIVSSMAAVLKPGRAIQMSIQDNDWLNKPALELPWIQSIRRFLDELLALPATSQPIGAPSIDSQSANS